MKGYTLGVSRDKLSMRLARVHLQFRDFRLLESGPEGGMLGRIVTKRFVRILLFLTVFLIVVESSLRVFGYFYLQSFYKRQFQAAFGDADSINILCLGESSTAGLWVDWKDSYPKQMETMLRDYYHDQRIRVIVPAHVGQNSSQVSNRIDDYIRLYRPKLLVAMMGYNNEWSLAESHIGKFVGVSSAGAWKVEALIALDSLRLFKVLRYGYHAAFNRESLQERERLTVLGHPELVRYPPSDWVYSFAQSNRPAFVDLWRHDLKHVIDEAKVHHVRVLLMTYHINPTYLGSGPFVSLASEENIPLVRNDIPFDAIVKKGMLSRYVLYDHWHPNHFGYRLIAYNGFREIAHGDLLGLGKHADAPPMPMELQAAEMYPRYQAAEGIDFTNLNVQPFLGDGWSGPEPQFRWTDNTRSEILFALDNLTAGTLELRMRPFLNPGRLNQQRISIALNGRPIADLILRDSAPMDYSIPLPPGILSSNNVLQIQAPDAQSPKSLGVSSDSRQLGIAVERLKLR